MSESNVHSLGLSKSSRESVDFPRMQDHTNLGDGNGGGDDMYHKIKKLEKDVKKMKGGIKYIQATGATKMDLHQEISIQTRTFTSYIVNAAFGVSSLIVAVVAIAVAVLLAFK
ncbi:hypothetical protein IEQ60_001256 [Salmonella enterica]|nr:hypothetical protein [Salmonella enterica subsp. enterica serovar Java]EBV8390933.1 hypothetical protein [Salmonella enterica subsp. enterica serovar Virchow]EFR1281059.1 hypothetical protein [Salmonella enterica]ECP8565877.1 hypothetical protein [Salmonella enterica subsp. enterica serovar Java]EGH2116828.1 hypothetical protein [Salmonella enterica]